MDPPVKPEGDGCGMRLGQTPHSVIAGLDPAIQERRTPYLRLWMPGSSPGMTTENLRLENPPHPGGIGAGTPLPTGSAGFRLSRFTRRAGMGR